jgi:transcription initiation factor TFIIIB Brf1 subunit/transcription initiation factor TFIIB
MYAAFEQAKERQQAMIDVAAEQRHGRRLRKLGRVTRRVERAERQLAHGKREATRLTAELEAGLRR